MSSSLRKSDRLSAVMPPKNYYDDDDDNDYNDDNGRFNDDIDYNDDDNNGRYNDDGDSKPLIYNVAKKQKMRRIVSDDADVENVSFGGIKHEDALANAADIPVQVTASTMTKRKQPPSLNHPVRVVKRLFENTNVPHDEGGKILPQMGTDANELTGAASNLLRFHESIVNKSIAAKPSVANELLDIAEKLFEGGKIKVCLDDPGCNLRMSTANSSLLNTWPRAENENVVDDSKKLCAVEKMTKDDVLRAGLRMCGNKKRVCQSLAVSGLLSVALTMSSDSVPPFIADVVAGHNQTEDFNKKSGSTMIDEEMLFAMPIIGEALSRSALWIEGKDPRTALLALIKKREMSVQYLTDKEIATIVPAFGSLRAFYGMDDSHFAMLVHGSEKEHTCLVFACMQISSKIHHSGNFAIPFFHEWIRAFLYLTKAPRHDMFPPFTSVKESLLYDLQTKTGATKITDILHKNKLLRESEIYLSPCQASSKLQRDLFAKGEHALQSYAKGELEKRGIECDNTMDAQGMLQSDLYANGEHGFQSYAKDELEKRDIECDDTKNAHGMLQTARCTTGENHLQLHAKKKLELLGYMNVDPKTAICQLNTINNPMKNAKTRAKVSGKNNGQYKHWSENDLNTLRQLCKDGYTVKQITEKMDGYTTRTVHNKIVDLGIEVMAGRWEKVWKVLLEKYE